MLFHFIFDSFLYFKILYWSNRRKCSLVIDYLNRLSCLFNSCFTAKESHIQYVSTIAALIMWPLYTALCFHYFLHINKVSRVLILHEQHSANYENILCLSDLFNIVWFGWLASLFIAMLSRGEGMNILLLMKISYIERVRMMILILSRWLYFTRYTALHIVILINHSPDKRYNEIRKLPKWIIYRQGIYPG